MGKEVEVVVRLRVTVELEEPPSPAVAVSSADGPVRTPVHLHDFVAVPHSEGGGFVAKCKHCQLMLAKEKELV